ncbi:MAG: 4-hydroxy-tetrahydrodipicolinate reductase [Verrucomicrobia bacterium]|nr:4-hydroxy-tetrahydrodipicolinate reductase [Verrucomicrobiota bacterium]
MIKLVINGSKGRMGQAIIVLAKQDADFSVVGEVDLGNDINAAAAKANVIIDFSLHDATLAAARAAAKSKTALVIGTTGHTADEKKQVLGVTRDIPVVWAANYSTGVNTLFYITRKVAEILGPGFDQEIVEMHHRLKKDAPSGTAERLAQILAEVKQKQLKELARHGRVGIVGERSNDEIGIHAVRGGDVVGDHTVIFAAPGERVELAHKASSRETFARGSLRAAKWIVGKPAGLYDMQDVLGLK